jgi:hypothetical protein
MGAKSTLSPLPLFLVLGLAVPVFGLALPPAAAPAVAADTSVTIGKIPDKSVKGNAKVTVKPVVSKKAGVKIVSKLLSVTGSGGVVVENKAKTKLSAGTYKVKTVVKYKIKHDGSWSATRKVTRSQTLKITASVSSPSSASANDSVYYRNCDAAREAGAAPVGRGDPGYGKHLDRDGDGVGCE